MFSLQKSGLIFMYFMGRRNYSPSFSPNLANFLEQEYITT